MIKTDDNNQLAPLDLAKLIYVNYGERFVMIDIEKIGIREMLPINYPLVDKAEIKLIYQHYLKISVRVRKFLTIQNIRVRGIDPIVSKQ